MESVPSRQNPYIGPRAFQTGERLYGRDHELGLLVNLLIAERIVLLHSPSGAGKSSLIQAGLIPLLEERGFSVLPPIRINLEPPAGLRDDPYFNRFIYSALASLQENLPPERRASVAALAQMTLEDCLQGCFSSPEENGSSEITSKVLIFDQFEEILTIEPNRRQEKAAFFTQLGSVLRSRNRWALFAIREDYLAALSPFLRPVPTRLRTTYRLDLLGEEAACQAIQWPARQAGVDFTDEAVTKLVDDLRRVKVQRLDGVLEEQLGPYVEPVQLQVVCYRLWEHLPPAATQILPSDVESVGDVDLALANYYAERVAAVAAQTGASERSLRDWFDHRLITPQGIRSQVLLGNERSEGLDNRAIRLLENAHLLRSEKRGGATWFELAHDRLINPVRSDNAAWFAANLTLFQRQAALWETERRPESLLLRDQELEQAEAWAEAHRAELTETEHGFLEKCRDLRQREVEARKLTEAQQTAESERQRAELEARSARKLRRLATIIAGALVLAVITTIAAGFFWQQSRLTANFNAALAATNAYVASVNEVYASTNEAAAATAQSASTQAVSQQKVAESASTQENVQRVTAEAASQLANEQKATAQYNAEQASLNAEEANKQSSIAFSRQLASQSHLYMNTVPDLSLLLGVEAYRTADTLEAKSALLNGLQRGLSQTANLTDLQAPPETNAVVSVAISPDGERLAYGTGEGDILIWNYAVGEVEQRIPAHTGLIVWGVAFSPDGKTLASAGEDSSISLWEVASGGNIGRIQTGNKVLSVTWSPDGARLAGAVGPHVMIWDVNDLKKEPVDQNLLVEVSAISWSPDGAVIAAATYSTKVTLLNPDTGNPNQEFTHQSGKVNCLAWSADSRLLASGGADNLVYVWDIATGRPVGEPLNGHFNEVMGVAISHDKSVLASGSKDGTIQLWDLRTLRPYGQPLTVHTSDVNGLAFLPAGGPSLLASASRDKSVKLLEVITEQPLRASLATVAGQAPSLAVEPGGGLLAAALQGTSLSTWNVQGSRQNPVLSTAGSIASTALSWDGKTIAVGYDSGEIDLFETASGAPISSLDTQAGKIWSLAFSQDGQSLASGHCSGAAQTGDRLTCESSEILIWEISTGTQAGQPIQDHPDFVFALAFSPDGALLASGGQDKSIRLWDVESGEQVGLPLSGHIDSVSSLAFDPDGRLLASGSLDNTLIFWDVATNQPIGEPVTGSGGNALGLAFSPDSKFLYAGYGDGEILTWDVDFEAWVQRACGLAGRNLSATEWEQFFRFQAVSYRKTCDQYAGGSEESTSAATPTPAPSPTPTPTPSPTPS